MNTEKFPNLEFPSLLLGLTLVVSILILRNTSENAFKYNTIKVLVNSSSAEEPLSQKVEAIIKLNSWLETGNKLPEVDY